MGILHRGSALIQAEPIRAFLVNPSCRKSRVIEFGDPRKLYVEHLLAQTLIHGDNLNIEMQGLAGKGVVEIDS
ncbi:MAG: hypothetical protein GX422_00515, partial [Deltaproteobacteria bacterium]|nr:hypothetical protein [Deltaproteobacteria bacterium]